MLRAALFPLISLIVLAGCPADDPTDTDDTDADADTDADTDSDTDADTDADSDSDTDADTDADTDSDTDTDAWTVPTCEQVKGTAAVTWTADDGATLAPTEKPLGGTAYTHLVAMPGTPNRLYAESNARLLRSDDAGCTWTDLGALARTPMELTVGGDDRVYAWGDNDSTIQRIDDGVITRLGVPENSYVVGLEVDAADPDHVRVGNHKGQLFESTDGGHTWAAIGATPWGEVEGFAYRVELDPHDLDHALVGSMVDGAFVTTDGGASWTKSTGLSSGNANAFSIEISPVFSSTVWLEGIDLVNDGRHIYRSGDGGISFEVVVTADADVTLTNGTALHPHATDVERLYFTFGTYYDAYGTDVFRYDAGSGNLSKTHNDYDDVGDIVFSPADPELLYFGLVSEQIY